LNKANLESQRSGNQLKEVPDVLSRLGNRQETRKLRFLSSTARQDSQPVLVDWKNRICKESVEYTVNALRPGKHTGSLNGLPESYAVKGLTERYRAEVILRSNGSRS